MTLEPLRWKDSAELDEFARELLGASRPTSALPHATRLRVGRHVASLAAAPVVALGVGLWTKIVLAAFGAGFASALALVSVSPALLGKLERPKAAKEREAQRLPFRSAPGSAPLASGAPSLEPAASVGERPPTEVLTPSPQAPRSRSKTEPRALRTDDNHAVVPPGADTAPGVVALSSRGSFPLELPGESVAVPGRGPSPGDTVPSIASGKGDVDGRMSAEVQLLSRARLLLTSDPNQALDLLGRHARLFPGGALAMEREVLVIEALQHSGRTREAAARAEQLLAASPGAFYVARLKRITERR